MPIFDVELYYTINAIKNIPIEAESYTEARKKFKEQYSISQESDFFDGMETGPELDLSSDLDSIDVEIM